MDILTQLLAAYFVISLIAIITVVVRKINNDTRRELLKIIGTLLANYEAEKREPKGYTYFLSTAELSGRERMLKKLLIKKIHKKEQNWVGGFIPTSSFINRRINILEEIKSELTNKLKT